MTPDFGSFPLTGTEKLPNIAVAFPGEKWSDGVASGSITPGEAIVPASAAVSGKRSWRTALSTDSITQLAIAMRTVQVPDPNTGPSALGPNEIMNEAIANGEYVLAHSSGGFVLTLVDPRRTYTPNILIGWDADGQRPSGKSGVGSWAPNAQADIDSVFEVLQVRSVGSNGEVILNVRSLRGQF